MCGVCVVCGVLALVCTAPDEIRCRPYVKEAIHCMSESAYVCAGRGWEGVACGVSVGQHSAWICVRARVET